MRCEKFSKCTADSLREMGCEIAADNETATITGKMTLAIIQPERSDKFWVSIALPNGSKIDARCIRLSVAGGEDEEDDPSQAEA